MASATVKLMEVNLSRKENASILSIVELTTTTMDRIRACPVQKIVFNARVKTNALNVNQLTSLTTQAKASAHVVRAFTNTQVIISVMGVREATDVQSAAMATATVLSAKITGLIGVDNATVGLLHDSKVLSVFCVPMAAGRA